MAFITITTDGLGAVQTLREQVCGYDLENPLLRDLLVQRLRWAIQDADAPGGQASAARAEVGPAASFVGGEQRLVAADQTGSASDQFAADSDQCSADDDQLAADHDQAASDRDLALGGNPAVHNYTRDLRLRGAVQRRRTAQGRVAATTSRDAVAHARARAGPASPPAAPVGDRELAEYDAAWAGDGRAEIVLRAAEHHRRGIAERAAAPGAPGQLVIADREQAARDGLQAQEDRDALLRQLAIAETDALTGTRTRAAGLAELDHEIDRARRTTGLLAIAYVDVVGLKTVNDAHGHAAGDALLRRAVRAIRGHLRSYDSIIRLGGDEFLCVMSAATIQDARERFISIHSALAGDPDRCEIKVGFAALTPGESASELIARADSELPVSRRP